MLTIWDHVERNLVFFKILYVKNFFSQIYHIYIVEVIKYSFKRAFLHLHTCFQAGSSSGFLEA